MERAERAKHHTHWASDPSSFYKLCKDEGIAYSTVVEEMRGKRIPINSPAGRSFMSRRLHELRRPNSLLSCGPILHERAWIEWAKRDAGYDRVVDGVEEAKLMWEAARHHRCLVETENGEWGLPADLRQQVPRVDTTTKAPTCTANAEGGSEGAAQMMTDLYPANSAPADASPNTTGTSCLSPSLVSPTSTGSIPLAIARATASAGAVGGGHATESQQRTGGPGDQKPTLGQLLLPFPLPRPTPMPWYDLPTMREAYRNKLAKHTERRNATEYLLRRAREIFGALVANSPPDLGHLRTLADVRRATSIHQALRQTKALLHVWTADTAREKAAELDSLLGELQLCRDRIAEDISPDRGGSLIPASLH